MFAYLRNLLFYCGLNKEEFVEIRPMVREDNRKTLCVFSVFASLSFSSAIFLRMQNGMDKFMMINVLASLFFLLVAIFEHTIAKKHTAFTEAMVYVYLILLLGLGVYMGYMQSENRTTLLLVFYIFAAVLFCARIFSLLVTILVTQILYMHLIAATQTGMILAANRVNTLVFSALGAVSAIYLMKIRFQKHKTDYMNRFLLERDTLTGLYNRRSFEQDIEKLKSERIPVTVCAFDINGLKAANDNLGHIAGDELICGSAKCINEVFGEYGKVYRTGGDEFVALLDKEYKSDEELFERFKETQAQWKGVFQEKINVSCGIARIERNFDTEFLTTLKKAEKLMYEAKDRYYKETGVERRRV